MDTNHDEPVQVSDGVELVEWPEEEEPVYLSLEDEAVDVSGEYELVEWPEEDEAVEVSGEYELVEWPEEDEPVEVKEGDVGQRTHHTASVSRVASSPQPSSVMERIRAHFKEITLNKKAWDVQIKIGDKIFKSQRAWLAVFSKYFYRMFFIDIESPELKYTRDQPITLHDIDVELFEEFYHYIYTKEIRVNASNFIQFLDLNDKLEFRKPAFKERCIEYLKELCEAPEPISNALDLLEFASQKKEISIVYFLLAHISQHLYHYSKEARLEELSFEYLNSLLQFSKNYILPLEVSGNILLIIVHIWICHNPKERCLYRQKLMRNIDGANVSPFCSRWLVSKQDEVAKNTKLPSKLKTLETGMAMMDLTTDGAQLSGNISFSVKNVKELLLGDNVTSSSSITLSNLMWKIGVRRDGDSLRMYLYCDGTDLSSEWSCHASAVFTIKSNKEEREDFVTGFNFGLFSSIEDYGRPVRFANSVLKWNDLINPENGYIQDDGSIWLNAHVQADVPFRKLK